MDVTMDCKVTIESGRGSQTIVMNEEAIMSQSPQIVVVPSFTL